MTQYTCRSCNQTVDRAEGWYLEDDYALESGYCLALDDPDREDVNPFVCDDCMHGVGDRGDTYVIAMPEYKSDPEAGGTRTVSARVDNGILVSLYAGMPAGREPVAPDSPEFRLIRAFELDDDLPTELFDNHYDVADDAEWEQIGTGWHSSLEQSDVSATINQITDGELGIYGPVLVRFSETNNVCSIGLTVYAPTGLTVWDQDEHDRVTLRDYLAGKQSAPGGSFGVN